MKYITFAAAVFLVVLSTIQAAPMPSTIDADNLDVPIDIPVNVEVKHNKILRRDLHRRDSRSLVSANDARVPIHVPVNVEVKGNNIGGQLVHALASDLGH